MTRSILAAGLVFASLSLTPGLARADAIAPDEASCTGKSAGDGCVVAGVDGHCTAKKCNKLDYSDGSPPGPKVVDCVVCVTGGVADASASDASNGSTSDGGGQSTSGSDAGNGSGSGGSSSSSCALAGVPGLRTAGPWLLGALPLLVLRKRSRKSADRR